MTQIMHIFISSEQDLQKYLDEAEHGVIYFTYGSTVRSETFPPEKRKALLEAFSELPQKIIWKWEADSLPDQPSNVLVRKWLPQFDILSKLPISSINDGMHLCIKIKFYTMFSV